jgi:multiple sugar transport system substrate-binding protein
MKIQRLLAATVLVGGLSAVPAAAEDITLEFTVWNYSLDTIEDNARQFEAENPGIKVKITDYTWQDYHDAMVLRFRGGTTTAIAYVGQVWLPAWAAAGFLAPLEDLAPADVLDGLKADMAPVAKSDMTYDGKLYCFTY